MTLHTSQGKRNWKFSKRNKLKNDREKLVQMRSWCWWTKTEHKKKQKKKICALKIKYSRQPIYFCVWKTHAFVQLALEKLTESSTNDRCRFGLLFGVYTTTQSGCSRHSKYKTILYWWRLPSLMMMICIAM